MRHQGISHKEVRCKTLSDTIWVLSGGKRTVCTHQAREHTINRAPPPSHQYPRNFLRLKTNQSASLNSQSQWFHFQASLHRLHHEGIEKMNILHLVSSTSGGIEGSQYIQSLVATEKLPPQRSRDTDHISHISNQHLTPQCKTCTIHKSSQPYKPGYLYINKEGTIV